MTTASPSKSRPLSPHLGIYKPQISSVMSILHRASGVGLALALPFFVAWIVMLAGGQAPYESFIGVIHPVLGQFAIFGVFFIILLYAMNAIGHALFQPKEIAKGFVCFFGFIAAAVLTVLLVYCIHKYVDVHIASKLYLLFWYTGEAVLVGWTWAFFYHFCCGIRHLCWDAGWFLSIKGMHVSGWITILVSTALTVLPWLAIWGYVK